MHATGHGANMNTIKESALKVASGWEKVPCHTRESNLHQQLAGPDAQSTELPPCPEIPSAVGPL